MRSRYPSPIVSVSVDSTTGSSPPPTATHITTHQPVRRGAGGAGLPMSSDQGMTEEGSTTEPCTPDRKPRLENSGADLLLSLAEKAAEHAASPSSSVPSSTPSTPPPLGTGQFTRRAVSAERPSSAEHGKRLAEALEEPHHGRLPSPKRNRTSGDLGSGSVEEDEPAARVEDSPNGVEPKRIISPVDPKPEGEDESSEDDEKSSKHFDSKAHGFSMFHGPPHCLFPPSNGRSGYAMMPYGPAFPFPHAFYPAPYPYGMVHGPPHHMMYPAVYPQHPPSNSRYSSPTSSSPRSVATTKGTASKPKPNKTASQTPSNKPPTSKAMKSLPKKERPKEKDVWQEAEPTEGSLKSLNRCVPRKYLFPPVDWRQRCLEVDSVQVPDFHLLVNFPDYLARGRSNNSSISHQDKSSGMKHCVMCGKARLSTSSTLVGRGSTKRSDLVESQSESATHIIPRQNKGVCTACDVAVWVVANHPEELEIKWCKGCKNFRPWPAFGDKVLATKCVRCRERQKEKYAAQKSSNVKTEADVFAADVLGNLSRAQTDD